MKASDLQLLLEARYLQYNQPSFIEADPVSVPHLFSEKGDIEISGFLSALIAWGQRKTIVQNAFRLMDMMGREPLRFVQEAGEEELSRVDHFVHRTCNGTDMRALVLSLRRVYSEMGGLEAVFSMGMQPGDTTVYHAIVHARAALVSRTGFPARTRKHLADPSSGSSAKRINMFLRWMVRNDRRGVDFGIWKTIQPSQLICPLDVHTGNVARHLGLLTRSANDWKAAIELTDRLREFCPEDPVKYDFSLFGMGVFEGGMKGIGE